MKWARMTSPTGGDGGIRTRVRKDRSAELYERSRVLVVAMCSLTSRLSHSQPFEPESSLSHVKRRPMRHSSFVTPGSLTGRKSGEADVISRGDECASSSLMQRAGEQHIECDWHLIVCTELTRSVPLGSHSGISLFRRSLSSPVFILYINFVSIS
jgi:hypothetical protein